MLLIKNFQEQIANSDESRKPLKESMKNWLRVYKYLEVERTPYDRYECTAEHIKSILTSETSLSVT